MTFLYPTVNSPPLQGQDLNRFIQQWMAGVIGPANLAPDLIRPYDQGEPPLIPQDGVAWMAFQQHADESDTFVYTQVNPDTSTSLIRQERLAVLCSFYDLGTNGQAAMLASLLRDNLGIPDNLETLTLADFALVGTEPEVVVPSLLKQRWLYRVDLPFKLTRAVSRTYAVPSIEVVDGTLYTDTGLPPTPIHVEDQ